MSMSVRLAAAAIVASLLAGCSNYEYVDPPLSVQQQSIQTLDQASQLGSRVD